MKYIRKNLEIVVVVVLVLVSVFVWYVVITENSEGVLTVAFLDIGQGDSIFIEAPNGNQVLIDGGPNKKVLRELGKLMPFYDRSIDMVIATHPDKDHTEGLISILKKFKVSVFMESEVKSKSSIYNALESISRKEKVKRIIAKRGERIVLDKGVYIDILFPDRNTIGWDTNTASVVARLVYGDTSFLLTGDSPRKIEKYLISIGGNSLTSDVIKLGHHGSRTSNSEDFLSVVNPKYSVISAGLNNRYGHPNKEVVEELKKFKIPSLSTYKSGTIIFKSNGKNIEVEP